MKIKNIATLFTISLIFGSYAVFGQVKDQLPVGIDEKITNSSEFVDSNSIAGSWNVVATVPAPGGTRDFRALITFSEGGGMIASAEGDLLQFGNDLSPATAGHGAWARTGNREFLMTFRQIFYSIDAMGNSSYAGGNKVRHTAIMNRFGTAWSGRMTVEFFDENGQVIATGTGTATATRIVVEPLMP